MRAYLILLAALAGPALAVEPAHVLAAEIADHPALMRNLEELCDGIGPRMTGSDGLRRAEDWAMAKLAGYGALHVHREAYPLGRPWTRGVERARLLNASGIALHIAQKAWTPGTAGELQADVVLLDVRTLDQLNASAPALKGRIVLVEAGPRAPAADVNRALQQAGVAAVLLPVDRADDLLDMWGGPGLRYDGHAAFITREHANLLKRLLARGLTPRLALELGGSFGSAPVEAHNVVADFPGSDPGAGMVVLGAHLDSWDLGSGATDNGSGVVTMLEVLRALHASGLHPKRSLRVVLFSGEEQGLLGSRAYVDAHRAQLGEIQAVLLQDAGSGRIIAVPDMQVEAWYGALRKALEPAREIGEIDVQYDVARGSDEASFYDQGIPVFSPLQDTRDYKTHTHHSQVDSIDHVDPAGLQQAAQVTAVLAWGLLNGERLPHQPPPAQAAH